ncbi:sensor histidine kinase [Pseudoalteromonas fenneropenaei]|uniref:histidine kinase n=1 Tax=Pseudoalteromonas fenneropenaei TaxID=1737459 RepID=A0ABV7CCC2_9GAMM
MAFDIGLRGLKDNDFSFSIVNEQYREFTLLVDNFNQLKNEISLARTDLFQREQLLSHLVQQAADALILVDHNHHIVLHNFAARQLLNTSQPLQGQVFSDVIASMAAPLREASLKQSSGLVSFSHNDENLCYNLSYQSLHLRNSKHHLYVYKNLTHEIEHKQSHIWKQTIRLISHELNNSMAPMKSLVLSAQKIVAQPEHHELLPEVFSTLTSRIDNLNRFLVQYANFAKLPKPQIESVALPPFLERIRYLTHIACRSDIAKLPATIVMDSAQIEQVLINLIKNAKESGSPIDAIHLDVAVVDKRWVFSIADSGKGMSDEQLEQALLPFFTTKANGTGLGLTLCHDIVLAHGGKLKVQNNTDQGHKGVTVQFTLPQAPN